MDALNADEVQSYLHAAEFGRRLHWVRFRSFAGVPSERPASAGNRQSSLRTIGSFFRSFDPTGIKFRSFFGASFGLFRYGSLLVCSVRAVTALAAVQTDR